MATAKNNKNRKPRAKSGPTRAERLAAAEAARRRKSMQTRAAVAVVLTVAVLAVAFIVISNRRREQSTIRALEAGSCRVDGKTDTDSGPGLNHIPSPSYTVDPPAGGNHLATAAAPGVYTVEDSPPEGQIVHAMEHGYVILWHRTDLDEKALAELRAVAERHARDVLVVPRTSMSEPVAATAWHRRLLCSGPDPGAMEKFVTSFANQGPEKIPH